METRVENDQALVVGNDEVEAKVDRPGSSKLVETVVRVQN